MYRTTREFPESGSILLVKILDSDRPVSYREVLSRWQNDQSFRSFFLSSLREAPFEAAGWETPALTRGSQDQPFQYALVDRPYLSTTANPEPFQSYFQGSGDEQDIVEFPNLGGDARLIAPTPRGHLEPYAHLLSFIREAPRVQQHNLWKTVGRRVEEDLSRHPLWLNTAGGGVDWLHVRVDTRPKYYTYTPFKHVVDPAD